MRPPSTSAPGARPLAGPLSGDPTLTGTADPPSPLPSGDALGPEGATVSVEPGDGSADVGVGDAAVVSLGLGDGSGGADGAGVMGAVGVGAGVG